MNKLSSLLAISLLHLGCASAPPRLDYNAIRSATMGKDMHYAVYEPQKRTSESELPLIVFLHGGGDDVDCFDRAGLGTYFDDAIRQGRLPPFVLALPQGDLGFWENWADGTRRYRDWVVREMLPTVHKKYRTQTCPDGCHVMGISMGGHGALRFAFKEPDLFSSVTAISAPIFDTERMLHFRDSFWWGLFVPVGRIWGQSKDPQIVMKDDLYVQWLRQEDLHGMHLRVAWGTGDKKGVVATNKQFVAHLNAQKIAFSSDEFPGGHEWDAWVPVIERAIAEQLNVHPDR